MNFDCVIMLECGKQLYGSVVSQGLTYPSITQPILSTKLVLNVVLSNHILIYLFIYFIKVV